MNIPDGFIAVVKRDCPTCTLVDSVLVELQKHDKPLTVFVQDDPSFTKVAEARDDRSLEASFKLAIETVPTLLEFRGGVEAQRAIGWERSEWQRLTGVAELGAGLPGYRPGCGSKSVEPGIAERLAVRYGPRIMQSRVVTVSETEDDGELCFERGWTDGLPVLSPTEERVYRMLQGTTRKPGEVLGAMPPTLATCNVEKVAINAVMAGCKPEYFPVVLAAVDAALDPAFGLHGLLATMWQSAPMIIVNGPIRPAIGMNWGGNALGQGNRANATIGRALQLCVRNIGGGKPQETDMSNFGSPAKFSFCFAEDEDTPWATLAEDRGFARSQSTVTLFSADGPIGCADQKSRAPEGLVYSLAGTMRAVGHIDLAKGSDVVVVISPEHGRVFDDAGWSKARTVAALHEATRIQGQDLGMNSNEAGKGSNAPASSTLPKFRPDGGITLVRAGGAAGMSSVIIPGWLMTGAAGTDPVTKEIKS